MSGGNGFTSILTFSQPPARVVSLVPSVTESLFDLGAGSHLVGVTDFCRPPEGEAGRLTRVGGTKSPNVQAILRLRPDLVVANQEENSREAIERLEAAGLKVWVTFPRSVDEALAILWALVRLFDVARAAPKIRTLEVTLAWEARASAQGAPVRVFAPIWQGDDPQAGRWWMTFNAETYAHDVLHRCGGENVFADRVRRYPLAADLGRMEAETPGDRDVRYPRVLPQEVIASAPDVILLPDEPFPFSEAEEADLRRLLADTPAVRQGRVIRIDGSLLTWHGTRLARALAELPACLRPVAPTG
jgi:ABC-type Fe3+-hydroxamate transport system substrate-binding protein